MFQHLDDPKPLPASTPEQRQATIHRGRVLRRRRRIRAIAIPIAAVAVVAALVGGFFLSPGVWRDTTVSPAGPVATPTSIPPTVAVGPGTGSSVFAGSSPYVPVTYTMPSDGWQADNVFVVKWQTFQVLVAFVDVANIYTDGCQWKRVDPQPGPSVDDLVDAYVNEVEGVTVVGDVTVDGFKGKQIRYAVPDFRKGTDSRKGECQGDQFGLVQEDNRSDSGNAPFLWAQTPKQQNEVWILDVDGTRLVILVGYPPNISEKDRADLDTILNSINIG